MRSIIWQNTENLEVIISANYVFSVSEVLEFIHLGRA
jgi:hypothetical protein